MSALRLWGLAILCDRLSRKNSKTFVPSRLQPSPTLVLIFPGVGGQRTQFYWLMRAISKKCHVDLLYIHPSWGQTLDAHTQEVLAVLKNLPQKKEYQSYIAIGHSRGGLLAKYILDRLPSSKNRLLCTLATPWKSPQSPQKADPGLRGWVASKNYIPHLSRLFRWGESGTQELFQTYEPPSYEIHTLASLFDPIVGDPFFQSPDQTPSSYQKASHLSIPLEKKTIDYIVDIIRKHTEKTKAF